MTRIAIDARAVMPGFVVSAHTSEYSMSPPRFSAVGSSLVRVEAIVSPEARPAVMDARSAVDIVSAIAASLIDAPRRGLWQPSQVRRSPGRTWIQFRCVCNARPLASMIAKPIGVSAGTISLNEPSGSIGA